MTPPSGWCQLWGRSLPKETNPSSSLPTGQGSPPWGQSGRWRRTIPTPLETSYSFTGAERGITFAFVNQLVKIHRIQSACNSLSLSIFQFWQPLWRGVQGHCGSKSRLLKGGSVSQGLCSRFGQAARQTHLEHRLYKRRLHHGLRKGIDFGID